jgi:hypothetical protein
MQGTGDKLIPTINGWRFWTCCPIPGVGVAVTWWLPSGQVFHQFFPY